MRRDTLYFYCDRPELKHHGTAGQRKGFRRYQNPDGSLTPLGRIHYGVGKARDRVKQDVNEAAATFASNIGRGAAEYAYDRAKTDISAGVYKPKPKTSEEAYSRMYDNFRTKGKLKYNASTAAKKTVNNVLDYYSDFYDNVPGMRFDVSPRVSSRERSLVSTYDDSKKSYEHDARNDIRSYAFNRSDENKSRAYDSSDTVRQLYGNSSYYNRYERVANQVSVRKAMTKKVDEIKNSQTTQKIKDSIWQSLELMSMNIYDI